MHHLNVESHPENEGLNSPSENKKWVKTSKGSQVSLSRQFYREGAATEKPPDGGTTVTESAFTTEEGGTIWGRDFSLLTKV